MKFSLQLSCFCLMTLFGEIFGRDDVVRVVVEEDSDAISPSSPSPKEDLRSTVFDWKTDGQKDVFLYDEGIHSNNSHFGQDDQFKGRVSHFEDELKDRNASIKIRNTKVADSGNYSCAFPRLQPSQTFIIKLVVGVLRVVVKEDSDAILNCSLSTKEDLRSKFFDWKKDGQKEVFLYDAGLQYNNGLFGQDDQFKGRVSHFEDELEHGNASIKIRNTTVSDSGHYSCDFPYLQPRQIFHFELVVDVVRVVVEEDSDAILPCSLSTKEDLRSKLFDWKKDGQKEVFLYDAGSHYNNSLFGQDDQFKDRVSHFEDELEHGNASIKIRNTTVSDSGVYSCDFPKLQSRQTLIKLVVEHVLKDRSGKISGAARPRSTTLKTGVWALLQCVVHDASPKPKVEWRDSHGNIVHAEEPQVTERGGSYDIILKAPVTKSGNYRCVVTQEEIYHQTEAETYANPESHTGLNSGLVVAIVVLSIALVAGVLYFKCRIKQISTRVWMLEEEKRKAERDRMLNEEKRKAEKRADTHNWCTIL